VFLNWQNIIQTAIDYLVRDVIWYKLIKYGVRGNMLGMYEHVRSRVNINCMNCIGFLISYVHMLRVLNKHEHLKLESEVQQYT